MERNRDFRRATITGINGLPRRRQRITTLRDSTDEDGQMELKETARLRDRERLQKKERDREFPKRRRVDRSPGEQRSGGGGESYRENESSESSDEEYCEEEKELKNYHHKGTNQLSPSSSSLPNNRRGIRTLRSSSVFRFPSDEIFGIPVPRRARSVSAKRLQKCWIYGSVGFGEDLSHRRFSPTTASPIGFDCNYPASSCDSMKKIKYAEQRTRVLSCSSNSKPSTIQDDIEIEVAEALFDLMKQSHSQSVSSKILKKVDRESTDKPDCELKAEGGEDENNFFSGQTEQSREANAEIIVVDTTKNLKKERRVEKDKISYDPEADGLTGGDKLVNKGTLGSQKENKSPSCVKVNACDVKDPTMTKAEHGATVIEYTKEARLEIDLMASPPLSTSPEREVVVEAEIRPEVLTRVVQKRNETMPLDGAVAVAIQPQKEAIVELSANELPGKRRHGILSNSNGAMHMQQPLGQKEQKIQSSSLFPFPIGLSSWSGVFPHPGYMPPFQTTSPIDGNARSTMIMRPPQFKLSLPQPKRCATHQHIARNIDHHQQLIQTSLPSEPTDRPGTSYVTESLNTNTILPTQQLGGSGQDKNPGDAAASSAASNAKPVFQQSSNQGHTKNLLHCPGLTFPLGQHHSSMMVPVSSSGPPQSASAAGFASLTCSSTGKASANLSFPAVGFNQTTYPSNGTAPYMTILQNNIGPIPISANMPSPSFKGGSPSMPLNSSLYSSSVFNINNQQHQFPPHCTPVQSSSQNTTPFNGLSSRKQPECQKLTSTIMENKIPTSVAAHSTTQPNWPSFSSTMSESEIGGKSSPLVADGRAPHSVKSNYTGSSFPVQPMRGGGGGGVDIKNGDHSQQGCKGRVELVPPAFALSFGTHPTADPAANFSSMLQSPAHFQMLNGTRMAQHKNSQSSEGKFPSNGDHSSHFFRSDCIDMSASSTMVTSKSDGLTRTVYYCPSSLSGNQPFLESSAALASGVPPPMPNFQQLHHQQQLTQLQQHHAHQMQLTGASQVKASAPNSIPCSYLGSSFPTNSSVYSQLSAQPDVSSFSTSKWTNSSQPATSANDNILQLKSPQGQTHITFGNSSASVAASLRGQHMMIKGQQESSLAVGSNSSIPKNTGSGFKNMPSVSSLPSSPMESSNSPNGPSQKSPPACRRNIPSILSACPNQLSELKY